MYVRRSACPRRQRARADHRYMARIWRGTTMGRLVRWGYGLAGAGLLALAASAASSAAGRLDGFNVIATPDHPFGSASAGMALAQAKQLGANAVAIIPFLWQASPASPNIIRASDMPDDALRAAIRQARSAGLAIIVKPHVWVPQSWAGAVAPMSENDWSTWFAGYREA